MSTDDIGDSVNVELPWEEYISDVLKPAATLSSNSKRSQAFHGLALKVKAEGIQDTLVPQVVSIMIATLPRFHSAPRKLVLDALVEIYKKVRASGAGTVDNILCKAVVKLLEKDLKSGL
ncbi:hypothetical protein HDV05_001686, partial [Chytridiales sp. JEL 0842]